MIVIEDFQISLLCVLLVFIDAAVLFVIITLHMRIAIYEANMGHLQVILIVPLYRLVLVRLDLYLLG